MSRERAADKGAGPRGPRPAEAASTQPSASRTIRVGGIAKPELLSQLESVGVRLNDAARALFADDRFTTASTRTLVDIVELPVSRLGFRAGTTFERILARAEASGLALCPLEAGPHFRLQYIDQPEGLAGKPVSRHRAPPGSITVASAPLADDDDTPKGFYLRRIDGVLWLRGYRSWPGHLWSPSDVFAFSRRPHAA